MKNDEVFTGSSEVSLNYIDHEAGGREASFGYSRGGARGLISKLWRRRIGLLLLYGLIILAGHWCGIWIRENIQFGGVGGNGPILFAVVVAGLLLYVVLLAIPFVPGIEISLGLLAAFGRDLALPIYLATMVSLTIAFIVGRQLPLSSLGKTFRFLGFRRAEALVGKLAPLSSRDRLALLLEAAPKRLVPTFIEYRYIAIIAILNVPGNAIVGGGGGIALLAGISGLFTPVPFIVAIAIAVIPIPLAAYLIVP